MAVCYSNFNSNSTIRKMNKIKLSNKTVNYKNNDVINDDKSFDPHSSLIDPLSVHLNNRLYRLDKFVTTITNRIHRKKYLILKKSPKFSNQNKLTVMEQFSITTTTTISLAIMFIILLQHANMIMQRTLAHPVSLEKNHHPKSLSSNKIDENDDQKNNIIEQKSNQPETIVSNNDNINNQHIHTQKQHSWIERNKRSGIADQRLAELLELARMDMIRKLVRDNTRAIGEGIAYGLIDPAVIGRRRRRRRDVRSVVNNQQQEQEYENDEDLDRLVANLLWQQIRKQRLFKNRNNKSMAMIKGGRGNGQMKPHPEPSSVQNRHSNPIAEHPSTLAMANRLSSPFSWLWYALINEKKQLDQSKSTGKTLQKMLDNIYQE